MPTSKETRGKSRIYSFSSGLNFIFLFVSFHSAFVKCSKVCRYCIVQCLTLYFKTKSVLFQSGFLPACIYLLLDVCLLWRVFSRQLHSQVYKMNKPNHHPPKKHLLCFLVQKGFLLSKRHLWLGILHRGVCET